MDSDIDLAAEFDTAARMDLLQQRKREEKERLDAEQRDREERTG